MRDFRFNYIDLMRTSVSGLHSACEKLLNPIGSLFDVFMFPDMDNPPANFLQKPVVAPVPLLIFIDFLLPKICICLWLHSMNWTAMPKATIDEDRHSCPHEYYVGSPRQVLTVESIPETTSVQNGTQAKLGLSIDCAQVTHELPYDLT
jgi:hypothetical protein